MDIPDDLIGRPGPRSVSPVFGRHFGFSDELYRYDTSIKVSIDSVVHWGSKIHVSVAIVLIRFLMSAKRRTYFLQIRGTKNMNTRNEMMQK
jgi:hypothetical protein